MTATLTVASLYETDTNVRVMIDTWVGHRRCPAPLGDYLEETYDLTAAADCARWVATEVDRRRFDDRRAAKCGPFPSMSSEPKKHYWYWMSNPGSGEADNLPESQKRLGYSPDSFFQPHEAIIWLLDSWIK